MPSLKNLNDFKKITEDKVQKDGYAPWQTSSGRDVVSSEMASAKPAFRYDDSDLGYVSTRDNENLYADYQSPLESLAKGVTKFVGDVGIGIVGNLTAIPVGIASSIYNGDATKLFDNDYTAALDRASDSLSESLPFYYKSDYADKNLFQRLGTANFWWDKVLGGASFTVSALAAEAIAAAATAATFGGATPALVGTTARVISKAGKIFRAADRAVDATKGAAKGFRMAEEAFQVGQAGIRAAGDVTTTATGLNRLGTFARQQMFGTMYEASVEARHHSNELREALIEDYRNKYGVDPNENDLQSIEREVASSGTASFLSNIALLSATNMAMYKNFTYGVKDLIGKNLGFAKVGLAPGRGVAKGAIKEVEEEVVKEGAEQVVKEGAEQVAKETVKDITYKGAYDTWSKTRQILDRTWTAAKQPLTEGFEESMQSIISHTLKDYHMHRYNPESINENASLVDSFGKAIKKQYSFDNADAWEENFIGMFLGALGVPTMGVRYNAEGKAERGFQMAGGIFQEIKDRNIEIQRERDHAEFLNKTKLDSVEVVKKTMQNAIEMHSLTQEQQEQIKGGNFKGAKDSEANMAFSFFKARFDTGRFESAVDGVVENINKMSTDEFAEQFGYSDLSAEELQQRKQKVVDSFVSEANAVKESIKEVDRIAPTVSESIRTGLAHTLYRTRNSEKRYNEIIDEVASILDGTVDPAKIKEAYALITKEYEATDKRFKLNKERLAEIKELSKRLEELETPDPTLTVEQSIARNAEIKQILDKLADSFQNVKMDKNNTVEVRKVAATMNELSKFEESVNKIGLSKLPTSIIEKITPLLDDLGSLVQDKITLTSLYNYLFTKNGQQNWDKVTKDIQKLMLAAQTEEGLKKLSSEELRKLEAVIAGTDLESLGKQLNLGILKDESDIQIAKAKSKKEEKTKKKIDAENKLKGQLNTTLNNIQTNMDGVGDTLKGSVKILHNRIKAALESFNKDALLITSPLDLKELSSFKSLLTGFIQDIKDELTRNNDPASKDLLTSMESDLKDLISAIDTSLKVYADKKFIRGSNTTPYRDNFNNLKRRFSVRDTDSKEVIDFYNALTKELYNGTITNDQIQEAIQNGKLTISTVKSPLPSKPFTYSDRNLQYTPYPVLAKVYIEVAGKKQFIGVLDATPVNLRALDQAGVDTTVDWFRSIPGLLEKQMQLINPNYVTGTKLNDKGEILARQAQTMLAFFNNVINGQEGLDISSEEIAKYFDVGKGDFTYLSNDIRPSVKDYLLANAGSAFQNINVLVKNEKGVESVEQRNGVIFYDSAISTFSLIGLDGVTYKIEGKQESDIWNRYHKNNPIVDTILKYNTYYVIYKKPSGDPMISAVELSKPRESVEDTAQRFDSFVNQILSVDISGEEVAFPDNAITEKSKKQSGFTIVNLDGSYYSFFDFNNASGKEQARKISASLGNTTFGQTEDGTLFIPLRNTKGVKDESAEDGITKREVTLRVEKQLTRKSSINLTSGKPDLAYDGRLNFIFSIKDKLTGKQHNVYFSVTSGSLIKDANGNITGIKKDANGNFNVYDQNNKKTVAIKDVYDLFDLFNNSTSFVAKDSAFKDFGSYEINIKKDSPDTSGFRIISKSPESMLLRVSSDGAIKFTPKGDAPIIKRKEPAKAATKPSPGASPTSTPTTGNPPSPELIKKIEDLNNTTFEFRSIVDFQLLYTKFKAVLDRALSDNVISQDFYDEKMTNLQKIQKVFKEEFDKSKEAHQLFMGGKGSPFVFKGTDAIDIFSIVDSIKNISNALLNSAPTTPVSDNEQKRQEERDALSAIESTLSTEELSKRAEEIDAKYDALEDKKEDDDFDPFAGIYPTAPDDDGGGVYSFTKSGNPNVDIPTLEEAINNLKEFLPAGIQVADINTILDRLSTHNIPAGVFLENVIYLNKTDRSETTEYHEAFHAVLRVLMTDQEIDTMFGLAVKLYTAPTVEDLDNLILEDPKGRKNLTDEQLLIIYYEEKLATDFANYVAKRKSIAKNNSDNTTLKTYFEKLKQKVQDLESGASTYREQLESIFDGILDGNYKTREVRTTPHPFFLGSQDIAVNQLLKFNAKTESNQKRVQYLSTIETNRLISQTLNKALSNSVNGNYSINDIKEEDIWNAFQQVIEESYNPQSYKNASFVQNKSMDEKIELSKKLSRIRTALYDIDGVTIDELNRAAIAKEVLSRLEYYTAIEQEIESSEDSMEDQSGDQLGAKESYTVGGFGSAPAFMRFYMSTIDVYEDIFGIGVDIDSLSDDEKGLFKSTANGFRIYTGLTNRLCDLKKNQFLPTLLQMTNNPAVISFKNKFIADVVTQYNNATGSSIDPQDIILLTGKEEIQYYHNEFSKHSPLYNMFTRTFKLNRINPRTVIFDPNGIADSTGNFNNVRIGRSNLRGSDTTQVEGWANNWLGLKKITSGKDIENALISIKRLLNTVYDNLGDLNNSVEIIQEEFKKLGIELHPDYIKYSIVSAKYDTYKELYMNATSFDESNKYATILDSMDTVSSFVYAFSEEDINGILAMVKLQRQKVKELFGKYTIDTDDLLKDEKIERSDSMNRLLKIASGNSVFDETVLDSNFRNADGETVYDKTQSNYITSKIKMLGSREARDIFSNFSSGAINFDMFVDQLFDLFKAEGFVTDDDYYDVLLTARNLANNPLLSRLSNNLDCYFIDGLVTQTLVKDQETNEIETLGKQRNGATYGSLSVRDKTIFNLITYLYTIPETNQVGEKRELYFQNIGVESDKNTHFMVQFEKRDYSKPGQKVSLLAVDHFYGHLKNELQRINRTAIESNDLFNYRVNGVQQDWITKSNLSLGYEDYHYIRRNNVDFYFTTEGIKGITRTGQVITDNIEQDYGVTVNSFRSLNYFNFKPNPYKSQTIKNFLTDQLAIARQASSVVDFKLPLKDNVIIENMLKEQFESYLKDLAKPKHRVIRRSSKTGEYLSTGVLPKQYVKYKTAVVNELTVEEPTVDLDLLFDAFLNYELNNLGFSPFIRGEDSLRNASIQNAIKREAKHNASGSDEGSGATKIAIIDEEIEQLTNTDITGVQATSSDRTDGQGISKMDWLFTHLNAHGKLDNRVKAIHRKHELGIVDNSRLSDNDLKYLEDRGALAQTLKLVAGSSSKYLKFALTFLDRRSVSRLISGDGVKQTVSDLITLKHYIQDNNGQIDKEQFNEIAENYFPDVDTLSVKDIEIVLQNFYESIPGYEYYHNLLNDMELSESDWVVYKSGSKEANKDVGYYDGNNWVLYPSEFANNTIREQVVTENLKVEGVDGTQKLQLIGYEQYEEAHTYFNSKSTSVGEIKDAHAKMLAKRVNLGFQQVKNMILTEKGEAQWKFLIDSFKDNIRAAGGDPLLEEFTEMNGIRPMYNTNYSYIESRFQSAFLNFVSKEVLKHKSAQVKFTLITDKGINVARSISFNDDNIDQNYYTLAQQILGKVGINGEINIADLTPEQQEVYNDIQKNYPNDNFEISYLTWYNDNVSDLVVPKRDLMNSENDGFITETSRLRHRFMDTDGKYYSECIVSEWFLNQYGLKVGDTIPPKLLKMLGVRIPTQDKHSMVSLKIVDFVPAIHGNNIIVPFEYSILSGGDFDIDALYTRIFKTLSKGSTDLFGGYLEQKLQDATNREDRYYKVLKRAKEELMSGVTNSYMFKKLVTNYFEENSSPVIDELNDLVKSLNDSLTEIESDETLALMHELKVDSYNQIIDSLPMKFKKILLSSRNVLNLSKKSRFTNLINDVYILKNYIAQQPDPKNPLEEERLNNVKEAYNDLVGIFNDLGYSEPSLDYLFTVVQAAKEYIDHVGNIAFEKVTGFHADDFNEVMMNQVIQNKNNFDNGNYSDIQPLTVEESENLLLDFEINLLHNSGNKQIAGTPATIDEFDEVTRLLNQNDIVTGPQIFTQHGLGDHLRLTEDIDAGKKNIGIAAVSNVKGNLLAENDFKLSTPILGSTTLSGYNMPQTTIRKNNSKSTVITGMTDNTKKSVAGTYNLNKQSIGAFTTLLDAGITFERSALLFKQPIIELTASILESQSGASVIKSRSERSVENKKIKGTIKNNLELTVVNAFLEDNDSLDELGSLNVPLNQHNLLTAIYYAQELANGTEIKDMKDLSLFIIEPSGATREVELKDIAVAGQVSFTDIYKSIQIKSFYQFQNANNVNNMLFPLGSLMSLIKGLPNSFAEVDLIIKSLNDLGIEYVINGDYRNPDNITLVRGDDKDFVSEIFAGVADSRENPVLNTILNTPLLLQNIKTTIMFNESSKNHFLMNTRTGKNIMGGLIAGKRVNAEKLSALRSQALSFIGIAAFRKQISDMIKKDPTIKNRIMFHLTENPSENPNLPFLFDIDQLFIGDIEKNGEVSNKIDRYDGALQSKIGKNNKLLKSIVLTSTSYTRNPNSVFAGKKVLRFTGNTIPKRNQDYMLELVNNFEELVQTGAASATHAISKDIFTQGLIRDNFRFTKDSMLKHISPKFLASYMSALNKVHFTFLTRLDSTTDQKERDNLFIELFGFPEIVFINELQQSIFRGKKTAELRGIVYNPLSAVKSDSRYVAILNELSKTDKLPPLSPTEANQNLKGANEKVSDKKAVYPFKKPASENTVMSGVVTVNDLPIRALNTEVDGETVNYMVFDQFAGLSLFTEGDKRSTVFKENLRILKNTGLFQMESRTDEQGKTLTSMALPLIISTVSYDLQGNPITRTFKLVKFVPANPDAKGKKKTVIWSPLSGIGDLSEGKRNLLKKKTDDMDLEIYGTGRLKGEKMFTDAEIDAQSKKDLVDTINFTNDRLMETLGRSGLPLGTSAVYVETFEFGSNEVGSNGATVAQWENMWNNRDLSKMENASGITEDDIEGYTSFLQFVEEGNDYSSKKLTREEKESLLRETFFGTPLSETDDTVCNTKSKK